MKKAIIIGGGIAGLSAAIALKKIGFNTEVYEAVPEIKMVGAGIIMASNAMQVFGKLGIAEKVKQAGIEMDNFSITDRHLKPLLKTNQDWIRKKYGFGITSIHRGNLQKVLIESLGSEHLFLGKKCIDFHETKNGVHAKFEDGSLAEGDFILGADGIHSNVRKQLFAQNGKADIPLRQTGQTCWRGIANLPASNIIDKKGIESWGNQRRFGIIQISDHQIYWFAVLTTPPNGKDNPLTLNDDLKKIYSKFNPLVSEIIQHTPTEQIIRNDIYDFKPFKNWSSKKVCLIGDAAHATTPNMGQGGCQAVEDAWALFNVFQKNINIKKAFQLFEDQRFTKTSKITNQSFSFGKTAHYKYGQGIRNWMFRRIPESLAKSQSEWILNLS